MILLVNKCYTIIENISNITGINNFSVYLKSQ
nr:MAG TPA_asm: hypothetical protein [Caudoviricetes sp.]